ncbi:MAG: cytochrome c, partial [Bacteroidetes bacterium]
MKKAFKLIGMVVLAVLVLLGGAALYFNLKGVPTYDTHPPQDLKVEVTPERVARGKKIAASLCNSCHLSEAGKLEGKLFLKGTEGFGTGYAPNITQHPEHGIGSWTDGELYYLLRTGIKRDGKLAFIAMPRSSVVSDEDYYSIIAYLRSDAPEVQPSAKKHPPLKLNLLAKVLMNVAFKPLPFPESPVVAPPLTDAVAHGRYLVNGPLECFNCHSADFTTNDIARPENSKGYLQGGTVFIEHGDTLVSPNITMDP